uniref:Aminopeptidase n=1 Tax=Globisporangium ultimum (strain ATCC 200006 / CBS 805.95 / DAOM BR144) TaxID=431595 RepID=K3W557_GLOUD
MADAAEAVVPFTRLPTNVVPERYHIDYEVIDLMNFRFEGSERVELRVQEAGTKSITCHALELYVFNVSLQLPASSSSADDESPKTLECESIQYAAKDDSVTFHFAEELPLNAIVTLSLQFHGFLNDQLRGFYRSEYDLQKEKRVLAVTQFEACDARRAFVCWDEPAIKAKFVISMVTDVNLVALSNMHVVQTLVRPKKNAHVRKLTRKDDTVEKVWKFAETPIMSTYLVAMVVGEFDVLSGVSKEGVIVNVYTAPGQSERGRFSLGVALQALSFFTARFGVAYPLKKLDMVAIPDFMGAMENWGLVTYSESYLLIDEKLSSQQIKMLTARVVCHELSHQWFGNLVTMEWWTGLWLNEGFAQFMEFEASNHIFPEWKIWDGFVQEIMLSSALVKDAMTSSHPIEVVVNHPHEADEIFDTISYDKGASVVRMLSEFLGRDQFYQGVHEYLVKFSYKNTVTEDLWDALEAASGVQIKKMASSWTKQMGFPLVTLKQNAADGSYILQQERFFTDQTHAKDDNSLWDVPLTAITSEDPHTIKRIGIWDAKSSGKFESTATPVVADDSINQQIQVPKSEHGWIKLNPSHSSFYIVNYPAAVWKNLQGPVRDRVFGVADRVSLLNSVFTLAGAGVLGVPDALDFTSAYVEEPEFLLWKEIALRMGHYSHLFGDEPFNAELQHYIRTLFTRVMQRLTWDASTATATTTTGTNEGEFRKIVIKRMGFSGDQDVIHEAKRRFHAYVSGDAAVLPADIRGVVFSIQLKNGDASHVKHLQQIYETSDFAEEKDDALVAMGLVPHAATKLQVLEWAVENVRSQDISSVFAGVASDKIGVELAWEFVQKHWDVLVKKYSNMNFGYIMGRVIGGFRSEARAVEIEAFVATKNTAGFARRINGALESVRLNSMALHRDRDAVAQWLKARSV